MTGNESRLAKLLGRLGCAGACCAALAAVAMLTAGCGATTPRALVTDNRTTSQTTDDAARQLCNGRHANPIKFRRLVVTLHAAIPANAVGRAPGPWTVTSAARMRRVQIALCALPKLHAGVYHCPEDLGISYRLRYYGPDGVLPAVTADATGCQTVSGLGKAARWAAESPRFWPTLTRAIGLSSGA